MSDMRAQGWVLSFDGWNNDLHAKGAVREINREIKAVERKMVKIQESSDRETARLLEIPVTDGLHGMTWQAAEQLACKWMTKNGRWGAKLSPPGADSEIDVESLSAMRRSSITSRPWVLARCNGSKESHSPRSRKRSSSLQRDIPRRHSNGPRNTRSSATPTHP